MLEARRRNAKSVPGTEIRHPRLAPAAGALLALLMAAGQAHAYPARTPASKEVACAVLERMEGDVRLLDETRSRILDTLPGAPVPCGSWVAVRSGWAKLRHRDGHTVRAGASTYLQASASSQDGDPSAAQWVLLSGQIFVDAEGSKNETRVLTANALSRLTGSAGIVIYQNEYAATQLTGFGGGVRFENRFYGEKGMKLSSGEASKLEFTQDRIVPGTPKAVHPASLRRRLVALRVEPEKAARYLKLAQARAARTLPLDLVELMEDAKDRPAVAKTDPEVYSRHQLSEKERAAQERLQVLRLSGGAIAPAAAPRGHGTAREISRAPASLEAGDPAESKKVAKKKSAPSRAAKLEASVRKVRSAEQEEAAEKKRLLQALSGLVAE